VADPQDLYRSAYNDYLRGNYDLAIAGFRQFLGLFPASDLADNSLYWIAESYFSQGQFRQAIDEFASISTLYSNSERLASALLRQGYAWLELNDTQQARRVLRSVVESYRGSDEAILAQRQLDNLGG
jgi:tol-pal system protein YbgF